MLKRFQKPFGKGPHPRKIVFLSIFFVFVLILVIIRIWAAILLRHETNENATPIVATIKAKAAPAKEEIILPGTVKAWHEAPIYARIDGYIKKWYVDIGDPVKEGQVLAEIEAPELDAQLRQAEADLKVVKARNQLAQVTALRWSHLLKTDSVSKQETDEKIHAAQALAASVVAGRANRDRLRELVSFERVTAPFSGVISSRTTDIGDLINAGSKPLEAKPLFRIVQTNPLRVYVKIPQHYSSWIKPKMLVRLYFSEYPGQFFYAKLLKTADAINPTTRTLLAQYILKNKKGKILPGGYTEVHYKMPNMPDTVRIPVNTLIFRAEGLQVAVLDQNNRVVLKSIQVSRDFGQQVEVQSGLKPGEQIILNPSDSMMNGEQLRLKDH